MSDDAIAPVKTKSGFLSELRLAVSFLTIIPVIDQRRASEDTVAASFAWFPIVGFAIGVALAAEDWLLSYVFAQVIRSVLIIISLTVVTGAVHLDGLADTADALGAGRDRDRALDILRDSRVGIPYLRESGSGTAFLNSQSLGWRRRVAVIFLIIDCAILLSPFRTVGALAVSIALLIAFLMHLFYRRWLGGVTGDLIGACGEVIEIAVLLTMSL